MLRRLPPPRIQLWLQWLAPPVHLASRLSKVLPLFFQPYSVVENEGLQATQAHQLAKPLAYASQLVTSERLFSTAGDIVTAHRSLLHPDHVDQLIFLKKTLKIGQIS